MRVLMTADTIGGVWTYALILSEALQRHGVTVALATMGRRLSPLQRKQVGELSNVSLHESAYRLCWMPDAEQDVAAAGQWLLQLEQKFEPDVVHLNDLGHGHLPWRAPILLVAHSCVFSWWKAVYHRSPPVEEWSHYHSLVRDAIANAQLVVAPSATMLDALLYHYVSPDAAFGVAVIHNGRDFPATLTSPTDTRSKEPLLFTAGRIWDEAKNLSLVAEVAEQIPWPVAVAGEQADPTGGRCITSGLTTLGFLVEDDIADWLSRAAIYLAPAKYEPFGLAILEAARAGCALVLGDIASLREVWGDAAVYVDPDSPDALRETICRLITQPEHRAQLANAAWQRAQRYSSARMAEAYHDHYVTLTSQYPAIQSPVQARVGV